MPIPFPVTVLLVKRTVDCRPFALSAVPEERIRLLSYVARTVPVPEVLNAFIAALLNPKNSHSEIVVDTVNEGPESNDPSVRMP